MEFKDFSRFLSDYPVLFKTDLTFKDFSRKPSKFKYFSSLREPCRSLYSKQNGLEQTAPYDQSLCLHATLNESYFYSIETAAVNISRQHLLKTFANSLDPDMD